MRNKTKILLAVISIIFLTAKAIAQDKPEVYVQLGHTKDVRCLALSNDCKLAASGSYDNTIKLWDVATGRLIRTLQGHSDFVSTVAFSPDGKLIASGSFDRTIILWDVETGRGIRTLGGFNAWSHSINFSPNDKIIAFSPDSKMIASVHDEQTIKIWDVATGKMLKNLFDPNEKVRSIIFSPDGSMIASIFYTKKIEAKIKLWDVATGKKIRVLGAPNDDFEPIIFFSPDGRLIASSDNDYVIKLLDVNTGKAIKTLMGHSNHILSFVFSPDNRVIKSVSLDGIIKFWDISTGKEIKILKKNKAIEAINFPYPYQLSLDGKLLISKSKDDKISVWDVENEREITKIEGYSGRVTSIDISPDCKLIAFGSEDKTISLWDVLTGREVKKITGYKSLVNFVAFSSDNMLISTEEDAPYIKFSNVSNEKDIKYLYELGNFKFISLSQDRKRIVFYNEKKWIELWDVDTRKQLFALYTGLSISSLSSSPDGKLIVAGSSNGSIYLWDVANRKEIKTLEGHSDFVSTVAFSPDGKLIASGSSDETIKLWAVSTGEQIKTLEGHTCGVNKAVFSPDGRLIASTCSGNTIKLWDVETGREIKVLEGNNLTITSLSFSSDGSFIVSGSNEGTVRLWNVETGKEVAMFVSFKDGEWIVITPEGYYDASANGDKYLNVRIGNNVYGIENYRESFFRPDLVKSALAGIELKEFKTLADIKLPPQVEIINAPSSAQQEETDITVKLTDQGGGIGDVRLYLNESAVLIDGARGMKKVDQEKTQTRSYRIKLVNGENVIKVVAFNADNTMQSNAAIHRVVANLKLKKPSMYVLAIGINEFKNPKLELQYAVADAKLFVEALKESAKELFEKIEVRLLTTKEETTKESIKAALEGMRGISPEDVFVFYVASHGIAEEGEYFLLTSNVGSVSTNRLREDALTQTELKEMIANVSSTKKFIALDACHSGKLGEELQVAMLAKTRGMSEETAVKILSRAVGSMILSASTTQQEALEGYQGHGLFTYVLAEGIKGNADKDRDGIIRTVELSDYVDLRVPELAEKVFKRAQYPTATPSGQAFPIGTAK